MKEEKIKNSMTPDFMRKPKPDRKVFYRNSHVNPRLCMDHTITYRGNEGIVEITSGRTSGETFPLPSGFPKCEDVKNSVQNP